MSLIMWNDSFSVGIKELDDHHKKLVALINELHDAMRVGKSKEVLSPILQKLAEYTVFHFASEEKYMTKFNYPGYQAHKTEHDQFVSKVTQFQSDLTSGKVLFSMELMSFLKDWLIKHIQGMDRQYTAFFNENGIK